MSSENPWSTLDPASVDSPQTVHACLVALARARSEGDYHLCRWLLRADELRLERCHGYASLREYAERVLGESGRGLEDRLRVGRALRELPELGEALRRGDRVYTAARELCRVATADTEREWLDATAEMTCTQVREAVAGRARGDRPSEPARAELRTHRVTLELDAEVFALWKDARALAVQREGGPVDDSRFMEEALLAYVGGGADAERDAGVAAYQVALTVDPLLHRRAEGRAGGRAGSGAVITAGGEDVTVDEVVVEMARCDGQELGRVDAAGEAQRAKQTIPPKTRRQVVRRHGGRCAVPGCRHTSFVQVHHLDPRAEGGGHDPERLVALCTAHHRAAHHGALVVEGRFSDGYRYRHADGCAYGAPARDLGARRVLADAFTALTSMGWREREARALLDGVRVEVAASSMDLEQVVRLALTRAPVSTVREERVAYRRCA